MANSGSITQWFTDWNYMYFSWEVVQQVAATKTSTIQWELRLISTSNGRIDSSQKKHWSVTVDGETFSGTKTIGCGNNTSLAIASGTKTVQHDSDGSKELVCSFSQDIDIIFSSQTVGTVTGSDSWWLYSISAASQPSCVTWPNHTQNVGNFGDTISIHMNSTSIAHLHTVRYAYGSLTGTIATGVENGCTWTIPLSFMDLIPNATSGSGTIYVDTYFNDDLIGTKSCGFTATVPASVKPTCTATLTDTTGVDQIYGKPVKGLSKIKVKVNPTLAYSSPIASYSIIVDGIKYTDAEFTSNVLTNSGTVAVTVQVTDKRGRSGSWSYNMTVLDYAQPKITAFTVHRCNSDGSENEEGNHIKVTFSATIKSMSSQNTAAYKVQYKKTDTDSWTIHTFTELANAWTVADKTYIFAADGSNAYDVAVTAEDRHFVALASTAASTAFTLMNFHPSGKGISFGGVSQKEGYFEVHLVIEVDNVIEYTGGGKLSMTLAEGMALYHGNEANRPWCRKNAAGMVEICGCVTPSSGENSLGSSASTTIFTLPEGYRPAVGFYELCQGSEGHIWLLSVATNGQVAASRYRNAATYTTPMYGTWMPFHLCFMADQ